MWNSSVASLSVEQGLAAIHFFKSVEKTSSMQTGKRDPAVSDCVGSRRFEEIPQTSSGRTQHHRGSTEQSSGGGGEAQDSAEQDETDKQGKQGAVFTVRTVRTVTHVLLFFTAVLSVYYYEILLVTYSENLSAASFIRTTGIWICFANRWFTRSVKLK